MRSCPSSLGILDLKPRAKNQDLLRSLWGILVLGFSSEIPRFVQESWGNLGSWFLVLVRKFQDLFRSPGEILVLGFGSEIPRFVQESWGNLGSWF